MHQDFDALLELTETRARAILASFAPARTRHAFDQYAAVLRARDMLKNGMHPHEMAYRLAGRYGTSIKTAQRRIKAALDMGRR